MKGKHVSIMYYTYTTIYIVLFVMLVAPDIPISLPSYAQDQTKEPPPSYDDCL